MIQKLLVLDFHHLPFRLWQKPLIQMKKFLLAQRIRQVAQQLLLLL
jgi:hypothetical protein